MSNTPNYDLYLTGNDDISFLEWRKKINGTEDSNMMKIDAALKELAETPGTPGKDGKDFTYDDFTPEQLAALKGADGTPGIVISETQPTSEEHPVWLDPNGDDADGVSLGVTGATIGQIAKISAIDANGVPTAWEPVDMPAGGGSEEWELVFTETIAEDTGSYSRNVDTNGEAFELDEAVLIVLTLPFAESTNSSGRAIGMSPTSYWGHDNVTVISNSVASGAQKVAHYDVAHVKVINGYQICLSISGSQNDTNAFGAMMPSVAASARIGVQFYTDQTKFMQVNMVQGKITCVKILGYTNPLMSAGSIVSLYKRKGA